MGEYSKKMKRIFITHILPESEMEKYKVPVAASNFSFNLIAGGCFDEVYSIAGTDISGELPQKVFEDERFCLIYNNYLRKRGGFLVKIAALIEQVILFRKIPKDASVWFYNLTTVSVVVYILCMLFKKSIKKNVIVLDFTPSEKRISMQNMMLWLINKANSIIRLSNSDLFTCKNSALLPGVTPKTANTTLIERPNNVFLLSGVLSENISQISLILDVFSELPNCILHITGFAKEKENLLVDYSNHYDNIVYHGKVSFSEYKKILQTVTFVLSSRDKRYPENRCNFPSKIIESLLYNRAVVSTIKYKQIEGINYFEIASDKDTMKKQLKTIVSMPKAELMIYVNQGEEVAKRFNTDVWNETMKKLETGAR